MSNPNVPTQQEKDHASRIGDNQYFDYLDSLKRHKKSFTVIINGSTRTIIYNERTIDFVDMREMKGQGYHICRLVNKDIENFIINNPNHDYTYKEDYKTQLFNLNALQGSYKGLMQGIDIHSCYFETAYQLGYIPLKTYILANKEPSKWKKGRNASIGSLAKNIITNHYENGIEIRSRRSFVDPNPEKAQYVPFKQSIRHHIIGTIYKRFEKLVHILGKDYFMFLTDCIYCENSRVKDATEYLQSFGYKVKSKSFEIRRVDKKTKTVFWYDFDKNKIKYYNYIDAMVLNF